MKRPAPSLLLGLSIGVAAWLAWLLLLAPERDSATDPSAPPKPPVARWSWRDSPSPPSLSADSVGPAIDAWRDLRAPDGSPADYPSRVVALRALLLRLPSTGYPRLIAALPPSDTDAHRRLRQLAYDAWTELDAPAAARWAVAAGRGFGDFALQATRAWAALDANAAATWACSLSDQDPRIVFDLGKPAIEALAKVDPARALALVRSLKGRDRATLFGAVANILGQTDPAAVLQNLPPEVWNDGMGFDDLRDSVRAWARRDPSATLAWLAKQPYRFLAGPASWVPQLVDWPDPNRAPGALAPADIDQIRILCTLVAADPDFPQRAQTLGGLISRWGDPDAALAWLSTHADPTLRTDALHGAADRYGTGTPPERYLPFVLALPPGQSRSARLGKVLAEWHQRDPAAATAWMSRQDDPGMTAAYSQIQARQLADIANQEPATALAEWTRLSNPRVRLATIAPIAAAWAKTDPAAALSWQVEQNVPLSEIEAYPLTRALVTWAEKEPETTLHWAEATLAKQPSSRQPELTKQLITPLVYHWGETLPRAAAADLYSKIKDPALRAQTLTSHIKEWLTKDPAAAQAWLAAHPEQGLKP
jgi:hypothetical protein